MDVPARRQLTSKLTEDQKKGERNEYKLANRYAQH